jgi:prepilin-type N-terminal cleavage/methylation domain-containing protein
MNAPRKQRGFNLLELMIVVAISAILAAIAIPAYLGEVAKANAKTLVESIQSSVDWSHQHALNTSDIVVFTPTQPCSWTISSNGVAQAGLANSAPIPNSVSCSYSLQASAGAALTFIGDGSVSQTGTPSPTPMTYTVTADGVTWTITVLSSGMTAVTQN